MDIFIKPTRRDILAAAAALGVCPGMIKGQAPQATKDPFVPVDGPNRPIGVGKGIHPGRVVWVHRPEATSWDGVTTPRSVESSTGQWWDDANCNPKIASEMVSTSIKGLAGKNSDKEAWDALFRHFNRTRGFGDAGYKPGEKISIKMNSNNDRPTEKQPGWTPGRGMASPQVVQALLRQLVEQAGVPGKDIYIYDVANPRYISDPIFERVRADSNPEYKDINFVVSISQAKNGRIAAVASETDPVRFSQPGVPIAYAPTCVTEAKYRINMSLFRAHNVAGVTLTQKNNFGSIYFPTVDFWGPRPLHKFVDKKHPMGAYNAFVDLIGHNQLGGKNMLYLIDGMYAAQECEVNVIRFQSFGGNWTSSIFASQDPVAIDSVGLDFLRNEPVATPVFGYPDNFMHEAALAENPPSGIKYHPSGEQLTSLGTHEHWNNPKEKKYSRNLGEDKGIELVTL